MRINSRQLTAALSVVAGVCPSHSPNETLKFVRLTRTEGDRLTIYATNQETAITHVVAVEPGPPINVLVRPDRLTAMLRGLDEDVTLDQNGDTLILVAGGMTTELEAPPATALPDFSAVDSGRPYTIDASDLRRALRICQAAAEHVPQAVRPLHGVCIETGDVIHCVATDAKKMAVVPIPYERDGEIDGDCREVVPLPAVKLIANSLPETGTVGISFWLQGGVSVVSEHTTVHTRTLAGNFPKWQTIVESSAAVHQLSLPIEPFLSSVQRVAVTTSVDRQAISVDFNASGIDLKTQAADVGKTTCHLDAPAPELDCVITLNSQYLTDALRALGKDSEVQIYYADADKPFELHLDDDSFFLVMPLES